MPSVDIGSLFDDVEKLRAELRGYEHESIYDRWILLSERQRNLLFAALDLMADTRDATWTFLRDYAAAGRSLSHLHVYGLLNALSLGQDATLTCFRVFDLPTKALWDDPDFKMVRRTRIEAAGHPSDIRSDGTEPHRVASVGPAQIEATGFQYRTYETETGKAQQIHVEYQDLVRRHLTWTKMALGSLLEPIRQRRTAYFRSTPADGSTP